MGFEFDYVRAGSREFYELKVDKYCREKKVLPNALERYPERQMSKSEITAVTVVYNNPKTVATLQNCLDYVDDIMAIVKRGISAENIYLMANPYSELDKCLGYVQI